MLMASDRGTAENHRETTAEFVSGEEYIPHPVKGLVPIYKRHPPKTTLPGWRCPDCGSSMPTMYDLWRADQNRNRLARHREEHEFATVEWEAFNEGVHHYRREIDRMLSALPANVSSGARKEVLD